MSIRPEQPGDYARIRELDLAAFAPSTFEAELVDALRAADDHVPGLCLVDDELRGHVTISHAHVGEHPALGLGPIAVDPAHQHEGIGTALMQEAIERASRTEYPLIALLGHPTYYPRFGFRPAAAAFGITTHYDAPPEAWMALALPAYAPEIRGAFRYAPAFGD
ncbi:GNAT family N-acetyltransferase [Solirubrobacter soli]|uniref:GNAT family N-acetyltransferase n=1 Tax=Solirubrobacter soli TaxID=363832 RepID=UPI00041D80F7|nr:N-acetyltransferase [Solirubrobacter soli]